MKNNILIISSILIGAGLVFGLVIGIILIKGNSSTATNQMHDIEGGGFTLNYETNGGNKVESEHICIACSPESYSEIPIPTKDGYNFDGWYYDMDFKIKVTGTKTYEISVVPKYDKHGCVIGYNDITIYAKWK